MKFAELQAHRWYTVMGNDILSCYAVWLIEPPLIRSQEVGLVKFYAFSINEQKIVDRLLNDQNIKLWYSQNFTDVNNDFVCNIVYEPETDMLDWVKTVL